MNGVPSGLVKEDLLLFGFMCVFYVVILTKEISACPKVDAKARELTLGYPSPG